MYPEPLDLICYSKTLKQLVEQLSKELPYPVTVKMDDINFPDSVEILINEWVMIVLFIDTVKSIGSSKKKIRYSIEHIEHYHSHSRDEPDDVDTVVDITVDSPYQAIHEAFKLLLINDLDNAIASINEAQMIKDECEAEWRMAIEDQKAEAKIKAKKEHRELFDPL